MKLTYDFQEDGHTTQGTKIPDIPIVNLAIRTGKYRARGPAIVDTGFDGGVYPNMEIIRMFRGSKPVSTVEFESPLYHGRAEFEVYTAEVSFYHDGGYVKLGDEKIYIPKEPELIYSEVLIGREILNQLKEVLLKPETRTLALTF
jgi:hypothetical protein